MRMALQERARIICVATMLCVARGAIGAQLDVTDHPSTWLVTGTIGGYVSGNRGSVTSWLKKNGYGVPEPPHCGFNVLLQSTCSPPEPYPKASASGVVGWMFSVRKTMS